MTLKMSKEKMDYYSLTQKGISLQKENCLKLPTHKKFTQNFDKTKKSGMLNFIKYVQNLQTETNKWSFKI